MELLDLRQTLDAFAACNDGDQVWASFGWVHATDGDPLQARFWLPPDEESALDDDGEVPEHARALGLSTYLEPATFAGVLEVQKRQRPLSTLQDYAQALAHYAEYDAFLEIDGIDATTGEASATEQRQARAAGVGPGIFASFDLVLTACPDARIKVVAQQVARLLEIPVGEALARCRALPLALGEQLDRRRAGAIATCFARLDATLQVQGYRPFPWSAPPALD